MGSLKGKESLVEDRRALKNANIKGIKIYVDDAKSKTQAPKSLDNNDKQMVARKPLTGFRKSVPCDVVMKQNLNGEKVKGKCNISVKGKDGRKALADVSNARSYLLRSRPRNGSKPIGSQYDGVLRIPVRHPENPTWVKLRSLILRVEKS